MKSAHPSISELLSGHAVVLHRKWRFHLQKRIVKLDGQTYVLYRFRFRRAMVRFEEALGRLERAGLSVQSICARTSSPGERLRHGNWLALSYLPGRPLERRPDAGRLTSLGKTMARLNALTGEPRHALFQHRHPTLPHEAYLAAEGRLTDAQRDWIRASLARLETLSATQLTHGDLYGDNIIVDADGSVGLIDYELMAYDLAGIELAATLLRPFCRNDRTRRALLRAYMASCPRRLRRLWRKNSCDFIFAAAARLALARQDRVSHIERQERLLSLRRLLPFGPDKAAYDRARESHDKIVRAAQRNEAYYRNVARVMVDICIRRPGIGPVSLLRICDQRYRKARGAAARRPR
ncbi:phosphotransferase enzyme family protein [Rhizobium sp. GN54]|uniref:phosphotransferase enzyme family protein n=1 Tax=Rhizobium sp. GN54 TaxID=2898150 RepID=UPI001E5E3E2C|nr:phosphotransferase [Rhizobium sp. GN54]MCD2181504.1 phosphotransferase [Rhizobium sp. GN54]